MTAIQEHRFGRPPCAGEVAQVIECRRPEGATALLTALADDRHTLGIPIDIPNPELHGLAHPRPGVVQK